MSVEQNASSNQHNHEVLDSGNSATTDCPTDNNNNNSSNEHGRVSGVVSPPLTSPTSSDDPLTILTRGPDYLRTRIFQRQSGFERQTPHKSAAESLLESKRLFLRQESECDRVMSTTANPSNVSTDTTEEMSSESRLVESLVSKLCIPKTESPDGGATASHGASQGANPPTTLRTATAGKRRICTKADDPYSSQKQRQRLGSTDANAELGRLSDVAEDLPVFDAVCRRDGNAELSNRFPKAPACRSDRWTGTDTAAAQVCRWNPASFSSATMEHNKLNASKVGVSEEVGTRMERSDQTKLYESHSGCGLAHTGVECMEVQSEARHQSATTNPEARHQCDGALCHGTDAEAHAPDCRMDGDDTDAKCKSGVSPLPANVEWRECRSEMIVDSDPRYIIGSDRADDGKGPRLFRRFKKVVGKSSSRSDLMNRLASTSEQRNSADLDAFFSEMGMDRSAVEVALTESHLDHTVSTTSLNVFENISSIGTPLDSRSCTSHDSQPMDDAMSKSLDLDEQPGLGMSVVERNARVIRWLCNIRRVSTVTDDGEV